MSVNKSGGDVDQANFAAQANFSNQDLTNVAPGAAGLVGSLGGSGLAFGEVSQNVSQDIDQSNFGVGGDGGNDNIHADTNIVIGG